MEMKWKINKAEILKALEIVKPGLASQADIEQTTSFAFVEGSVVTYNDRICIRHPLENCELTGAIKAQEFYALLSKIKKDEVELDVTDNEVLLIAGRGKAGMTLDSEIKLPLNEVKIDGKWKKLPEGFLEGLQFASQSCDTGSVPILTCIHVCSDGVMESTDSFRISKVTIDPIPVESFLLPVGCVRTILGIKPSKIVQTPGWVHFKNAEGTILSCRVFSLKDNKYPELEKHLEIEKAKKITFPKTLAGIVERASIFSKRGADGEILDVTISENTIKIKGTSAEGWYEEEGNMKYTGKPVTFAISPYLLKLDVLEWELGKTKIKFTIDNKIYMAMLRGDNA